VDVAEKSKKKLKDKYADQWTDPAQGSASSMVQTGGEEDD